MKPGELATPTGVLVMTAEQMAGDRESWLKARRKRVIPYDGPWAPEVYRRRGFRIGSSEVPSILDLDGVDTPAHVWRYKELGIRTPANERMQWGHLFEPVIANEWCRRNRSVIDEIGLVAHIDKPWHISTIDRRVRECPTVKGLRDDCGCEVKNVGYSSAERWGRDIPDRILAQIVHQLFVTGYHHMHYAINVGGNMMRQGIVYAERERKLMDYIVAEVDRFRDEHLLTGIEPAWDIDGKTDKMIALDKASHPQRAGELDLDGIGEVIEYAEASRAAGDASKRLARAKARLLQLADGAEVLLFSDRPAVEFAPGSRATASLERLAEKYPDAAADPEVVRETTFSTVRLAREYRIKPSKG